MAAKKILLPRFKLTELAEAVAPSAVLVNLLGKEYHVRPKHLSGTESGGVDGKPRWMCPQFNLLPLILDGNEIPWAEANVYLLARVESSYAPAMSSYASIADSLAAFRRFLDESGVDWTHFPAHKLRRPTYRYRGHLQLEVEAGRVEATTARRRMSAVISFYSWLQEEGVLTLDNPAWKNADRYIELKDARGFKFSKKVTTTDVSFRVSKQGDPYDGKIDDGGKLRPLSGEEQVWLIEALHELGNTEMTLIHLCGLLTGARIQSILTLRVRHVMLELDAAASTELRFSIGPGTGIDTKNNKQLVLHMPVWFYDLLRTYARSERAKLRRTRAVGGDTDDQYLFLSVRGAPLYRSKAEAQSYNDSNELRYEKSGQGVRQFIAEKVIPFVREKFNTPSFSYQFHDTRATYGMNLTDNQLARVARGEITLHEAREFVKTRMGHESSAVTDRYLKFRGNLKFVRAVESQYAKALRELAERVWPEKRNDLLD